MKGVNQLKYCILIDKKKMEVLIFIFILLVIYIIYQYNSFVRRIKKVKQAESSIDVYLTQRFDLIPNLIECVKAYMEYEKETFMKMTEMRANYLKDKDLNSGEILNKEFNRIILTAESYPELKANQQFLHLQKSLTKMENQLQAARRIYNSEVTLYNTKVNTFPSNIISNIFNFKEYRLFEAENEANDNISVKI